MKILNLQIENGRKITFAEITPDGDVIKLVGKNEAGKSTILQAIKSVLTGSKEKDFIKHGEKAAVINLKIGDDEVQYEIRQRIKSDGTTTLVVKNEGGFKTSSPRKFLDDLVESGLACDPVAFVNMPKKERKKTLIKLLGIEDELFKIDAMEKEAFDERTFVNRELKTQTAITEKLEAEGVEFVEPVDIAELNEELQVLHERDKQIQAVKNAVDNLTTLKQQAVEKNKAAATQIKELKEQIKTDKAEIEKFETEINTAKASEIFHGENGVEELLNSVKEEMKNAAEINKQAAKYESCQKAQSQLADLMTKSDKLTEAIGKTRDEKTALLLTAKTPLKGLAISPEGDDIIYNDTAFDGLSDGAKLLVSLNMALSMTGAVKIALVKDASRLDIDNRKLIEQWAAEKNVQIWIEQPLIVENQEGILIEEGEIKNDPTTIEDFKAAKVEEPETKEEPKPETPPVETASVTNWKHRVKKEVQDCTTVANDAKVLKTALPDMTKDELDALDTNDFMALYKIFLFEETK